jgi:hypothetical protein
MTRKRELILAFTRDLITGGEQLGAFAQGDRPPLGHARVHHPPAKRRRVHGLRRALEPPLGLGHHPGRAAHGLHAPGEHDLSVPGLDGPARLNRGLEARRAEPVHRDAGDTRRQPREQNGHSCDVSILLAGAVGVAEDDVVDPRRIELRVALENGRDDVRAEVVGPALGQRTAVAPKGRADRVDYVGVSDRASLRPRCG